jgi:hypothetical protein
MTILFTPEELVQYLYGECSPEKAALIEAASKEDWALREKMDVLKSSSLYLDRQLQSPRSEAVMNVLRYAAKTAKETTSF